MYFKKESNNHMPNTSFVRYCVELYHRVDGLICKENYPLFNAYCTKNYIANSICKGDR